MWRILRPDANAILNDKKARSALARYFNIVQNNKIAKYLITKRLSVDFGHTDSTSTLWSIHDQLLKDFYQTQHRLDNRLVDFKEYDEPKQSFLDLKIEIARRILKSCHLCSRRCSVNRVLGELGYCKCGNEITVSSMFQHMGEEPELVPSGTIFTLGCTMRCLHCQNWTISQWVENGQVYSTNMLATEVDNLMKSECRNVNLVGGDPTPWLPEWLGTFRNIEFNTPIVWNSNSYYSPETAKLLAGFADVFLLDFKYGQGNCAKRISDAAKYWEACTRNHIEAAEHGELIIRVLVLPNHLQCCTRDIFNWISQKLGPSTRVNIMFQYRPEWRAYEIPELRRRLTSAERETALHLAKAAGLNNFIT